MTKAWEWAKKWGLALLGGLLFFLSLKWILGARKNEIGRLKDNLAVTEATSAIERLRAVRARVMEEVDESDESVAEIDQKLAENRRLIVEAATEDNAELTDDQIEEEFAKLGI